MSAPKKTEAASMNVWTPLEATAVSVGAAICCMIISTTVRKVQYVSWLLLGPLPSGRKDMRSQKLGQSLYFPFLTCYTSTAPQPLLQKVFIKIFFTTHSLFVPMKTVQTQTLPICFCVKLYFCFHFDKVREMPQRALALRKGNYVSAQRCSFHCFVFFSGMWYCYKQCIGRDQQPQLARWISQQEGLYLVSVHHPRTSNQTCMSVDVFVFFFNFMLWPRL